MPGSLIREKVQHVTGHVGFAQVEFGVPATDTNHGREFLTLNVENLAPESSRGPNLPDLTIDSAALGTFVAGR